MTHSILVLFAALPMFANTTPNPPVEPTEPDINISVNFTSDSVYTNESILIPKEIIKEEGTELYTITLEEDHLLGYCIYNNVETPYIDGLKFNDDYITNWTIPNVDLTIPHVIHIKTVYTDDIAGMLAAAKDGDFSRLMSNPLMLIQIFYYIVAFISIVLGGFGLLKSKKYKAKDHNQIANTVEAAADRSVARLEDLTETLINNIFVPICQHVDTQYTHILEALVLSKATDVESQLAIVELFKKATSEEHITKLIEDVKVQIKKSHDAVQKAKADTIEDIKKVIEESKPDNDKYGGFSI